MPCLRYQVFDINTGELIKTLRGHTDSVMCLDINSKWIVSGAKGDQLDERWWRAQSETTRTDQRAFKQSTDNTIRVWDVATGRERHVLDGHANGVRTVRFDDRIVGNDLVLKRKALCTSLLCLHYSEWFPRHNHKSVGP